MYPELSILLPTYNGGRYCEQQIQSILQQSFQDFELLIVDDGSTDDTVRHLANAARQDKRIRFLPPDGENRGQKIRLLELLAKAEGELIGFADQDDIWEADKLDLLVSGLADAGMACGSSHLIDGAGRSTGQTLHSAGKLAIRPKDRLRSLLSPLVSAHAMIVRRELVSSAAFCSTAPFDWLIALDVQYSSHINYIENSVTNHRIHGENQSNRNMLIKNIPLNWSGKLIFPRIFMSSGNIDRFNFWRRLTYLANSPILNSNIRLAFRVACRACEEAWFANNGAHYEMRNKNCYKLLLEQLGPFAGSTDDLGDFSIAASILTSNWRSRNSRYMSR